MQCSHWQCTVTLKWFHKDKHGFILQTAFIFINYAFFLCSELLWLSQLDADKVTCILNLTFRGYIIGAARNCWAYMEYDVLFTHGRSGSTQRIVNIIFYLSCTICMHKHLYQLHALLSLWSPY